MTTSTTWSRWLSAALAERDWTQADLISHSSPHLDTGLVSRWLSGDNVPHLPNIRIACRALGVPAIEGMIAAGRLEEGDVGVTLIRQRTKASDLSAREFSEEAARRFYLAESITQPDGKPSPAVNPFATDEGEEGKSWAARRRKSNDPDTGR